MRGATVSKTVAQRDVASQINNTNYSKEASDYCFTDLDVGKFN